jgi:hypothetical protein
MDRVLARISHGLFTAAADPGMSIALRSVGLLDVLSSTPAEPSVARRLAKRRIHARLRRLATKSREKCGLGAQGGCRHKNNPGITEVFDLGLNM